MVKNKKYFVTTFPLDREKEMGDLIKLNASERVIICDSDSWQGTPVKFVICSHDIDIGDTVYNKRGTEGFKYLGDLGNDILLIKTKDGEKQVKKPFYKIYGDLSPCAIPIYLGKDKSFMEVIPELWETVKGNEPRLSTFAKVKHHEDESDINWYHESNISRWYYKYVIEDSIIKAIRIKCPCCKSYL